jgi:hypothetical protein
MAKDFSLTKYFKEQYIKEAISRDNSTYVTPTTGIKKSTSEYLTDKRKSNPQKETDAMRSSTFTSYDKDGAQPYLTELNQRSKDLIDGYELEDLERDLEQIYREMEQEAEPEGGPIADQYADELHAYEDAIRFIKNKGKEKAQMTYGDMLHKHYPDKYGPGGIAKDKDTFTKSSKFDRDKWEDDFDDKFPSLKKEGSCGYTPDGEPRDKPAGPHLLKLKEIIFNSFKKQ